MVADADARNSESGLGGQLPKTRRDLARVKTILRQLEIAAQIKKETGVELAPPPAAKPAKKAAAKKAADAPKKKASAKKEEAK